MYLQATTLFHTDESWVSVLAEKKLWYKVYEISDHISSEEL